MARSVKEWIGKTDDTTIPPRVKDRVFLAHDKTCHVCKLPILVGDKWDADHVIALINGGQNRESNIAPAHEVGCHPKKTKQDSKVKSKTAKIRQKHNGIKTDKKKIPSRSKEALAKEVSGDVFAGLPRRSLFKKKEN